MKINFYTRPDCSLCDEARLMINLVLEDISFEVNEINIETDDHLHEKYMLMIPVIEKEGEIIQYGNIDYITILEALS